MTDWSLDDGVEFVCELPCGHYVLTRVINGLAVPVEGPALRPEQVPDMERYGVLRRVLETVHGDGTVQVTLGGDWSAYRATGQA